ncbi:MAG: hypothetical protein J6112_03690 [Clostridia bacterium]|nr:hypothetical protein [Clostridia bacterium]
MKKAVVVILSIILFAAPFAAVFSLAADVKSVYEHTFTAALYDKYDLLYGTEGRKIVVVGGSSVCFGLDSALLEEETGRSVVDFGLYATLGTKVMLDLSQRAIKDGDTVVIAPELDSQTLSKYFNQQAVLEALDGRYDMVRDIGFDNYDEIAGGFLTYLATAAGFKQQGISPNPSGIYNRASFNKYGDIATPREENVMTLGYDANRPVELSPDIVSDDFIDYLNGYIDKCLAKGADVWFSFCPINKSGLAKDTTDESIYSFYSYMAGKLHCRVISNINDYILDEKYFYDTNFHLNDVGVRIRTETLAGDILRAEGNNKPVGPAYPVETEAPTETGTQEQTTPEPTPGDDMSDGVFMYRSFGKGLAIEGVKDDAKGMTSADIPREYNGVRIYAILADAFAGCEKLAVITMHDNISFVENNAFNIPSLTKLYIDAPDAEKIEAGDKIFGDRTNVEIYLPDYDSFESFVSGYWWGIYSSNMKIADGE